MTAQLVDPTTLPEDLFSCLKDEEMDKRVTCIKYSELIVIIVNTFASSLSFLRKANKLGLLVFQFAPVAPKCWRICSLSKTGSFFSEVIFMTINKMIVCITLQTTTSVPKPLTMRITASKMLCIITISDSLVIKKY